ncbi:MAG: tRNA uridine-5-carboxymethylaminomethyl(34) synthesis enzyme MnmG [Trueperaceae bacterium]|nr:tRNA uridine-5-carboxymethylaminomethyl(34) synthesis enzyme MnmG [Trueperaceae bacterium]
MVIGGGHAGIEASVAAAKLGAAVALVLPNPDKIGLMPCNPAIGGPGKSQIVYELHALGGVMGALADATAIHTRTLNASKGAAVRSLRVQNDRDGYAAAARRLVEATAGLEIVRAEAAELLVEAGTVSGVVTTDGRRLLAPSVVLCTGTFLAGVVWYGRQQRPAGRQGEPPARHLSASLRATGHDLLRLKTGTPPRIRADTVDLASLQEVPSDDPHGTFSGTPGPLMSSTSTWLTRTTSETHALINANLESSAMYSGDIDGRGPRYCPSIEDKVVRFSDKDHHLLFVEPDGIDSSELYLQGFSSSMPPILQDDMIRTLPGFERAVIHRYAYAVEYDALDPGQLDVTLMSRRLPGLFSAGQINGTSGYEEAAGQGLIAGINAARHAAGRELVTVGRDQGYIGVMLDDLVRGGIEEPYRMLTSRNEFRLLHRQDNANERLMELGHAWGLVDDDTLATSQASTERVRREVERLAVVKHEGVAGTKLLCRPDVDYAAVTLLVGEASESLTAGERERVETSVRYASYVERAERQRLDRAGYESMSLRDIDLDAVASLSNEGREALRRAAPASLGAAQRVRGVRDSDVVALLVHVKSAAGKAASRRREAEASVAAGEALTGAVAGAERVDHGSGGTDRPNVSRETSRAG